MRNSLKHTYKLCKRELAGEDKVDTFETVKAVESHRQFWKPNRIRIILLAESHKYTQKEKILVDYNKCKSTKSLTARKCPSEYVRFVYCLGYGENDLLNNPHLLEHKNGGTPQFWKIFYSCCNKISKDKDFHPILKDKKSGIPLEGRLKNKLDLLDKLKDRGIWLVDASIIGIDRKNPKAKKKVLKCCWQNYTKNLLRSLNPEHVIIIGKGVGKIIKSDLENDLEIPCSIIKQPEGCRKPGEKLKNLKQLNKIVFGHIKK